jgi:hypothetical protein
MKYFEMAEVFMVDKMSSVTLTDQVAAGNSNSPLIYEEIK